MPLARLLDIEDLFVRYKSGHSVLNGVSLRVAKGERVAILGPSGTGKTSLLRAINGFAPAVSGSIRLDGEEVTKAKGRALRAIRTRIGFISQRHDLVDALAVSRNVMAGALGRWSWWHALRFLALPDADELDAAAVALRKVGLEHKLHMKTADLSGGEHQRVAIARTLIQAPVLLLADEPIASLDPALAEQVLELLCGLAEENHVALLCSLHQPHLAERYFGRVIEMNHGRIIADRGITDHEGNESPSVFTGSDI